MNILSILSRKVCLFNLKKNIRRFETFTLYKYYSFYITQTISEDETRYVSKRRGDQYFFIRKEKRVYIF